MTEMVNHSNGKIDDDDDETDGMVRFWLTIGQPTWKYYIIEKSFNDKTKRLEREKNILSRDDRWISR